ncbi:MAG: PKD domain-containing protein, partial [Bacteroidia bacterium]|nr:PKD domain-containing protein [Bacteroidia bacterium]
MYIGFRHVVQNLNNGGMMHTNYVLALTGGNDPSLPGLAIDDILVFVPAQPAQLTVRCPNPSPNTLNVNAGTPISFPVNVSGQVGAAEVTVNYGDGTPNTVLDNFTAFPYTFTHTYANPGTYNYSVTVCQNGQQVTCTGTINVVNCPNNITFTQTSYSPPTSCGFANGTVRYNIQPPGNYTLSILPSGPTVLPDGFQDVPAGQYLVTATDPNTGCTGTTTVTFPAPLSIANVVTQNTTCGLPNGQVIVSLDFGCGTPPFTYHLENTAGTAVQPAVTTGSYSHTFTGVAAGVYNVRVTDASGANIPWNLNPFNVVNQGGSGPTFTIATLDPSGCNTNDGVILVEPTGGTQPYTITITGVGNNFQASQTGNGSLSVNNAPAGTYNVTVVDGAGCPGQTSDPNPVVLTAQAGPTLSATGFGVTSCTTNNGRIRITIGGGTASSYSLDGGLTFTPAPGGNPFDVDNLAPGNYNVVAVAAGCTLTYANNPVQVAAPPTFDFYFGGDPSFTANYAEPCGGVTDQDIWINGNQINPGGYTVFYDPQPPGSFVENNAGSVLIIHELVADTYLVRLTHVASGCTFERTLIVESPVGINQATTNAVPATCNANNGTINVFLVTTCGEPPFTYRLLNAAGTSTVAGPFNSSNFNYSFTNLAPGTYIIRVRDSQADTDEMTITVPAASVPEPQATLVAQPTGCTTQDGAFNVTLAAPVPNPVSVQVLLAGNVVQSATGNSGLNFSFTGLTQGLYTVRVTDATGCTGTTTIQLLSNLSFSFGTDIAAPTCTNPTATVTFSVSAGTAPPGDLTVTVNGTTSTETAFPFTRTFAPGTYTVQITGAGCDAANGPVQVVVPPVPSITILNVVTNPIVECGGTGGFSVELEGAAYPVNYVVSNATGQVLNGTDDNADGDNTIVFSNLGAGTYTLVLEDAVGCDGALAQPITLNEPTPPDVTVDITLPCPPIGVNPPQGGRIVVTVSGGQGPYSYTLLEAGAVVASSAGPLPTVTYTFDGLTEGTFRVEVRDAVNCLTVRDALNLTAPPPLDFNVVGTGVSCPGGRGSVRFSGLVGGTPPYEVSYNGTDFQLFGSLNNGVWPDLPPGTYTARIRDSRGCLSASRSVEVTPPLPPLDTLRTLVVHPRCAKGPANLSTGSITIDIKDGTPPYRIFTSAESDTIDLGGTPSFTRQGVAPGNYAVYLFDACTLRTFVVRVNPGLEVDVDERLERCITEAGALDLASFVRTPSGGRWEDRRTPSNVVNGVFSAPTPGNYELYYVVEPVPGTGCEDTLRLTIHPQVEAGEPISVCEGSETIRVSGTPPGGT